MGCRSIHAGGADANTCEKVFKLPDETFLDILSYFPTVSFRYKFNNLVAVWGRNYLPAEYAERVDVLRAVTQTCRTLRRKFLSWLWERVEACVSPGLPAWYIYLGNVLASKCHILLKNPSLAIHVRSVNVLSTISFHLMYFRRQRNVCHRHTLPDGHHPSCLRRLRPVLAEPPHVGIVSRSSRDDDQAQESIRGSNDTHHQNRRSTHNRSSHPAVVSKRRGCNLQLWGR